ncbi:alpha/beta fold hydrolase [Kribbella sp. C-35]|uniref:alpha/beta fold hydrolase n=1 Tax=Kribbella sp. C-35 TaxID=2789276 RepID=UPI003978C5E0
MTVLRAGRGRPVTLFVPGQGRGPSPSAPMLAATRWFAQDVRGTQLSFYYEESGHFDRVPPLRRQAERDAEEARVVADAVGATRALGISRGARALAGLLAHDPGRFERVVLVVPPGDRLQTPLSYRVWLDSLPAAASAPPAPNTRILVLGLRGDRGHPARAAEEWAGRLGARLELFPARGTVPQRELMPSAASRSPELIWGDLVPGYELMRSAATEFLNA